MMNRLAACLLLLAPAFALADEDPEPPVEVKKLQGTWDVVKAVKGGTDATKELKEKGAHVVIDKDRFTFVEKQGGKESLTIALDPKKKPAHLDIHVGKGNEVVKAIYKVEKDLLTIAFNEGKDRPASFDKAKDLLVLKKRAAKK